MLAKALGKHYLQDACRFDGGVLVDDELQDRGNAASLGGHARAAKLSKEQRSTIAKEAAQKRWGARPGRTREYAGGS